MKSWGWNLCCPKYKGQILRSYHGKIFDLHIQEILWPPYESNLENWNLIPSWILVVLSVGILHYLIRMKIVNTQCSIVIVAVVVRWSAFTSLAYLLSPLLPPPASPYYHNGDSRTNRILNWGEGAFLLRPYSILDRRPHSSAHALKCADCHYICCWLWTSTQVCI